MLILPLFYHNIIAKEPKKIMLLVNIEGIKLTTPFDTAEISPSSLFISSPV